VYQAMHPPKQGAVASFWQTRWANLPDTARKYLPRQMPATLKQFFAW